MKLVVAALVLSTLGLLSCRLDPAKVPPCSGRETFPDPCAAALRDAGAG